MGAHEGQHASDTRITRLQEAWQVVAGEQETRTLEQDQQRALILAQAEAEGLTQRQIAETIHMTQVFVGYQLRYYRFLITEVIKIPERRFRAYWSEHADPHFRTHDLHTRAEYEASVFQYIVKQITAGIPPHKPPRTIKSVSHVDIHKKADPIRAYRKEVEKRYKAEIMPVVEDLKRLLRADRSTYAPSVLGGLAYKLDTIFKDLFTLLDPVKD